MVHWLALLGLCAAYVQGGIDKLLNFPEAIGEMQHFGLAPAPLFAGGVIAVELVASALILLTRGRLRLLSALVLVAFTLAANLMANAFWSVAPAQRLMVANGFFEHVGLAGGFILVALLDSGHRAASTVPAQP